MTGGPDAPPIYPHRMHFASCAPTSGHYLPGDDIRQETMADNRWRYCTQKECRQPI